MLQTWRGDLDRLVIAAVTATVPKDVLRCERGGARAGAR
jgi:hypothetical protein